MPFASRSRVFASVFAVLAALALAGCERAPAECPAGQTRCADRCVDLSRDATACGACGTSCAPGLACVQGACELVCSGGTTRCGGACVDTRLDPSHCGACGTSCAAGQLCSAAQCASTCADGLLRCDGEQGGPPFCANVSSDNAHCGACGVRCPAGQACAAGACTTTCPGAQLNCGGACVDPATDRAHCGASLDCQGARAGVACASGQVCVAGACATSCPGAQLNCGGACVDPSTDLRHCGARLDCQGPANAGEACAPGLVCVAGVCTSGRPPLPDDGGTRFIDGGVTASGVPFFVNVGAPPALGSGSDLPIERVRGFTCDEAAAAAAPEIAEVSGAPGAALVIAPSGAAPCTFHLAYRTDGGAETRLSTAPGGYLIASAATAGGLTLACASDAVHEAVPAGPPSAREVHQVPIRCWAGDGMTWSAPLEVVAADLNHAAWVASVSADPGVSGAFTLTWVRDSTFQFMNLSDFGRPATDGTWRTSVSVVGQAVVAGPTAQLSPSVHASEATSAAWEPTSAEQARYAGLMDFDAGACPGGCLLDGGMDGGL